MTSSPFPVAAFNVDMLVATLGHQVLWEGNLGDARWRRLPRGRGKETTTLAEIGDELRIKARPAQALLTVNTSLGLIQIEAEHYSLRQVAEEYLLTDSPTSFCGYLDLGIANYSVWSVESLKKALLTDSPQAYGGGDIFQTHDEKGAFARTFTRGMHGHSMAPAFFWRETIDHSGHRIMLYIGGGSGCHSIARRLNGRTCKPSSSIWHPFAKFYNERTSAYLPSILY